MELSKIKNWYGKYERPISSISLVGGFVFDAVTLKRVDLFWENFWVVAHLVIVGVFIILVHTIEEKAEGNDSGAEALAKAAENSSKTHFWLVNILQFFFGGILSTYLVFYFRSSDILVSWPFLVVLALAFWANEALKKHYTRLAFQISLFFLSIFCFAIFLVPILLHQLSDGVFIFSGAVSLVVIGLFILIIKYFNKQEFEKSKNIVFSCVAGIFILVNAFYFTDLIPPIPLSLKDAGVYYSIQRNQSGSYVSIGEIEPWTNFFKLYPDFHYLPGQPVIIYSAIFSPSKLNIAVTHQWQRLDASGKWVTVSKVPLTVVGGRDGGFRTFSQKTIGLTPGHWRVNVLTQRGQVIGQVRFNLVMADALPKVIQKVNN